MKGLSMILVLVLVFVSAAVAIEPPEWVDPNRVGNYHLHTIIPNRCGFDNFGVQYSLKDSKDGMLVCEWKVYPEGAIVDDTNAMVTFTPQQSGIYYFGAYLYCVPNDPNACMWPRSRWEMSIIKIPPVTEWDVNFRLVEGGSS